MFAVPKKTCMELLEQNKLFLHNCDNMEFMAKIPDKFFELACIDPPYGIGANKMTLGNGKNKIYRGSLDWDKTPPQKEYFNELFRISHNQIIWGANHFIELINKNSSCWIFWDKCNGENDFADGELAWTSFNTTVRKFDHSWVGVNAKDGYKRIHPTQKPIALYKWLLSKYAKQGDKIFDSHLGSMSSVIAAYEMGFEIHGCELDAEYFEAGKNRVITHLRQLKIF